MAEQLVFHDRADSIKAAVREYWQRKQRRIARLLQPIPAEQQHLRLSIRPAHDGWDIRLVLMLPTGTLVVDEACPLNQWRAALDRATDKLATEIRKHKERLRHDDLYRRKRRREGDFAQAQSALDADHRRQQRGAFIELLWPLLRGLADHARRELTLAQLEGSVHPGELTVADLLDEVAARAWKDYAQRPRHMSLDQWLVQLLHGVLDEYRLQAGSPAVSVHEPIPASDARYQVESGWVTDNEPFFDEAEPLTLYQTLPDQEVPQPWQELEAREQQRWLLDQLRRLPPAARRAFTLHAVEGWDPDDIAMVQGRSSEEVRRDIEMARQALRQGLTGEAAGPAQCATPMADQGGVA